MSPEHDKKKASKSGLPAMFTRNYQNAPMIELARCTRDSAAAYAP